MRVAQLRRNVSNTLNQRWLSLTGIPTFKTSEYIKKQSPGGGSVCSGIVDQFGPEYPSSNDMLLKCRTNDDRYSSAGVGGLCVGFFSSLQGWFCVMVLCALQCAKNSVGSCRQIHGVCPTCYAVSK